MNIDNRVFGLDLLRAFAIFFVVYGHGGHILPNSISKEIYEIPILDGVTLFFVLSGFLIGRILLRTFAHKNFDGRMLMGFWVRRWFRTLPNYYLVLILLIISTYVVSEPINQIPHSITFYFVFLQNLAWPHPEFFGEAWSLAVEEWFYLFIPIPIYLSIKIPNINLRKIVIWCVISVIIFSTCYRVYQAAQIDSFGSVEWKYYVKMQVIARMDSLMLGVFGAYLSLYHDKFWHQIAPYSFIPGILLLILDRFMHLNQVSILYLKYFSLSITPIATLLLLPRLSTWHASRGFFVKVITFVSVTSYSMYLLNQAPILETLLPVIMPKLMYYLWRFHEHTDVIRYILFWVFTVSGSYVLYQFFERPVMNLRERWSQDYHVSEKKFQSTLT